MGGMGSGFQGTRRAAVEDGLTLSMSDLLRRGALVPGAVTRGGWMWHHGDRKPIAEIGYEGDMRAPDAATIRLSYTANGQSVDDVIDLDWTSPRYGGRRWWFLCPLERQRGRPPRRTSKLHLPPGSRHFGSRRAYGLTYQSCRDSRRFSALWRMIGSLDDPAP